MIAHALSALLPGRYAGTPGPTDDFWYRPVSFPTPSGVEINPGSAMAVSAVFGCIRLLRESLAWLPWQVYRRTGVRSAEKDTAYYLWRVLHDAPNTWQSPMEFKELAITHLCLRGNFYCQIRDSGSQMELWPLNPDRMRVEQDDARRLRYQYIDQHGQRREFSQGELFHVRGLSLNAVTGVSVLEYARTAVGTAAAQEIHGASLFKNGALPTFWIYRPPERVWKKEARENFRESWRKLHGGAENAGNPPILEDGMELRELGLSNKDSQWIESRQFSGEEICRFFGTPPHMIGMRSTEQRGNTEQQSLEYVLYTLGPLAARLEQAADRDLVADSDRYTKIKLDALLRGDLKSRYEAHNIGVQGGWLLRNEVRELEDINPIEGGDTPMEPLNMQPAGGSPDQNEQGGQPGKGTPKRKRTAEADSAFSILLEEAAARIAAHEISTLNRRIAKAAEDPDRFAEFIAGFAESKAIPYIVKVLDPICAGWLAMTGQHIDPSAMAPFVVADRLDIERFDEWKATRASKLAATLKTEFLK